MNENKKTPQDVRDQGEMKECIYPTELTFTVPMVGVNPLNPKEAVWSEQAIVVKLSITTHKFPKEKVREAINQICQTLNEYFG